MKQILIGLLLLPALLIAAEIPPSETTAAPPAAPSGPSLDDQLQALGTPGNQAPAGLTEKLYAVQNRYASLRNRHELAVGGDINFGADSFLVSRSVEAAYRYYISDRWFLSLSGNYVFNEFSASGQQMSKQLGRPPDVTVAKYRADLMAGYNLFYGKFRLTMDQIFYFDQYIALGPGYVWMDLGEQPAAVLDVGFSFWFGRNLSTRLGFKDYFFKELLQDSARNSYQHNILGYLQIGYIFGG